jgi:hypothetical protein
LYALRYTLCLDTHRKHNLFRKIKMFYNLERRKAEVCVLFITKRNNECDFNTFSLVPWTPCSGFLVSFRSMPRFVLRYSPKIQVGKWWNGTQYKLAIFVCSQSSVHYHPISACLVTVQPYPDSRRALTARKYVFGWLCLHLRACTHASNLVWFRSAASQPARVGMWKTSFARGPGQQSLERWRAATKHAIYLTPWRWRPTTTKAQDRSKSNAGYIKKKTKRIISLVSGDQ